MAKPVNLKGRTIPELIEALEYVIDQKIQKIKFLYEILETDDHIKMAKAYRDMRETINELRPVQYIVENQVPGIRKIFDQFELNEFRRKERTKEEDGR